MADDVEVRSENGVTWIRWNRPTKKNALTIAMYRETTAALRQAAGDRTRVAVLAGHPGAFTAGNDLSDFMTRQSELSAVLDFLDAAANFQKPLLAAVDGVAIGIGTTILLHVDAAWCTPRSLFRTPFVDLGLVPEAGSSLLLAQLVGPRVANDMLLAGRTLDGAEAARLGLVNALVESDDLERVVGDYAQVLARKAPAALRASKALIRGAQRASVESAMKAEATAFAGRLTSPEFFEAAGAFMQKRAPNFEKFD